MKLCTKGTEKKRQINVRTQNEYHIGYLQSKEQG